MASLNTISRGLNKFWFMENEQTKKIAKIKIKIKIVLNNFK